MIGAFIAYLLITQKLGKQLLNNSAAPYMLANGITALAR